MKNFWNPERYALTKALRIEQALSVLNKAGYSFRGDEHILDVVCGNGMVSHELAERVPGGSVLAIDISPSMLECAREHFSRKNLKFKQLNATKIDEVEAFDLIVSFACLHWVGDQLTFLERAYAFLKPGGLAIFVLYSKSDILWEGLDMLMANEKWAQYFGGFVDAYYEYGEEIYRTLAETAGFTVRLLERSEQHIFKGQQHYEQCIRSWLHHLRCIPAELHGDFMHDLSEAVRSLFPKYGLADFKDMGYPKLEVCLSR